MRLSEHQLEQIRERVRGMVPPGADYEVRVFGSRLNDAVRGGDVDIYLELSGLDVEQRAVLHRRLRVALEEDLDLPVDLVVQERGAPLKAVSVLAKGEGVRI